jgi:predicted helicase
MLQENLGLIFHRREELAVSYSHFLVTDKIVEHGALSSKTTCYLAPLYVYKDNIKMPNINPTLISELTSKYGKTPSELEIFSYIYAVVHSNKYRTKYANFLKKDFPRIPFAAHYETFKQLVEIGEELINLHLTKIKLKSSIKFDVRGSNIVDFVEYRNGRVYINKEQFFDGVTEKAWNFYIGGYQVLAKWLKSRKNRELSSNEIEQFIQITETINRTLDLMNKIDEIEFLQC